jgi:hypothetical protein
MGTRGCFGVRINRKDKISYNQYDSYPSGLGCGIARDIVVARTVDPAFVQWKELAGKLILVKEDGKKPTPQQIKQLKEYADLGVGEQSYDDWYCLLRNLQGELAKTLEAGYCLDSKGFLRNSLFCEWAYVVNLDSMVLEVYRGFQDAPHRSGRYARRKLPKDEYCSKQYYPVALVKTFPLAEITPEQLKTFYEELQETEEAAYEAKKLAGADG